MKNEEIVRSYLDCFFSKKPDLIELRGFLNDNFTFSGPLLNASSADQYIDTLESIGVGSLEINITSILSNAKEVAVLYDLITQFGNHATVEWFWLCKNKISAIKLLNDPRPFLQFFNKEESR